MQIISPDNDRTLHLRRDAHALQDLSANANIACEWAFLVNVRSMDSLHNIGNKTTIKYRTSHSQENMRQNIL